jgi:5'-nucleotidase
VNSGRVSVTPLGFDRTDENTFATLQAALGAAA